MMKKAPETYNDYLKRMEGFADFKPLTKEQWEAEVAANVAASAPPQPPKEEPQPTNVMSQFVPAPSDVPEDHTDQCLVCGTPIPPGPDFCSLKCEEKCEEARQTLPESVVSKAVAQECLLELKPNAQEIIEEARKEVPEELQSVSAEEVGKVEDIL